MSLAEHIRDYTGHRRQVAVVQAARGGAHASSSASTHVETTAEAVGKLEKCCSHLRLQSNSEASTSDAVGEGTVMIIVWISVY